MLLDQAKGYTTLAAEIAHRLPPGENDTQGMIRDISRWSGIDPNAPLNPRPGRGPSLHARSHPPGDGQAR
jgi:hypothetical protein